MIEYLAMVGFLVVGFVFMAFALQFSKYKQNDSGCCGGGSCSVNKNTHTGLAESVDSVK